MSNNRVTHFEIPSNNPEATILFFKDVFQWDFQSFGNEGYWIALSGDASSPGINGAIMQKKEPTQTIVNTIKVNRIDQSIRKIERAGGKITAPKSAIPGVGWLAYFSDPDGNIHGIWEEDPFAK